MTALFSICQKSFAHNSSLLHIKNIALQDYPRSSSTMLHISFENWHTSFEYILDSTISFVRWMVVENTRDLDTLSTVIISVIYFHSHCLFLNHFYIQ